MIQTQINTISKAQLPVVGNTPLRYFPSLSTPGIKILAKLEWLQPGGSVKARAALSIITKALRSGHLNSSNTLLDASSGNTAIAYATLLQNSGWNPVICLPENATKERIQTLQRLGAHLIFTSALEGTDGAQAVAKEIAETYPSQYYYADQYKNEANWTAHYYSTGYEIWHQTAGQITHFVAGLGTTGTFVGTGRKLKELGNVKLISLQPDHPFHTLEGWKHLETAVVPGIYDPYLADEQLTISSDAIPDMIKWVAKKEGILISPSAAGNLIGAQKVASQINKGTIVTTLADSLDRYQEFKKELQL